MDPMVRWFGIREFHIRGRGRLAFNANPRGINLDYSLGVITMKTDAPTITLWQTNITMENHHF